MKLFFVNGFRAGEEIEFDLPEITVGRELDNVVQIPVDGISRHHGKFCRQVSGRWTVEDTGSTNGIKCNRVRIQGKHELNEGDLVEFGDQMIRVTGLGSAAVAQVVFSTLENEEPEEITIPPPAAPAAPAAIPPSAASPVSQPAPPAEKNAAAQSVQEISEALKNGKLHLFGGGKGASEKKADHPEDRASGGKRRLLFSNRIYYTLIVCLAVMGIAAFYKFNVQPASAGGAQAHKLDERDARRFMLYYEKQIISPGNVFHFVLHIENGEASFQIDDLKSRRSFTRDKIPFTTDSYERFHSDLNYEAFFKAVSPPDAPDDGGQRDYRRMVVYDQGRLHELTVKNNMRPNAFERMEATINLFAENHALRTVSMTPEELRAQAIDSFNKAEDFFQNRNARPGNLRDAIHRYRLTVEYLDAFVPRPALWDRARKQLELAEKERTERLRRLKSEQVRLGQLREFAKVLPILDEIMALSEPDSPAFSQARKQRIQIDSYLRKHGGYKK